MWADIVFDQSVEIGIEPHVRAFDALGGVPRALVPDNFKAAVIRAAFGSDRDSLEVQQSYREAARHYEFCIDPVPPRATQKKGKVEVGVKYVKNNFMAGQEEKDIVKVREALRTWLQ
jgi:transposase